MRTADLFQFKDWKTEKTIMFVDEVTIEVKAGNGGNGAVSFRREKFVPHGGPNGGDGGAGGDIILEADSNLSTLLDFRYQQHYDAENGAAGTGQEMHGKSAGNLVMKVPIGTSVTDVETGRIIADLTRHGETVIIAQGGQGGRGNSHFSSSVQQAPKFAENGEPGEHKKLILELKLLADVGLIGYPNVGKSTLIAAISAAKPKIANYPFTTLVPNLGVVAVEMDRNFVVADIPGLIEGASDGIGLGHQFLRHIERTRLLAHLVDISGLTGRDPMDDYAIINRELRAYSEALANLPQVIVLSKIDVVDPDVVALYREEFEAEGHSVFPISAATRQGLEPLVFALADRLDQIPMPPALDADIVRITPESMGKRRFDRRWEAYYDKAEQVYVVAGAGIERLVAMTSLTNEDAVRRLQRSLEKAGIINKLRVLGAKEGDSVRIGDAEFDYIDEFAEDEHEAESKR